MKRQQLKKKRLSGFSLAETLMAVLILLLVASVIAAGIPAAANAYTNAVDGANAQAILSTTVNALRNELSTAREVEINPPMQPAGIYYYSSRTGSKTRLYLDSNTIKIQDYIKFDSYTDVQSDPTTGAAVPPRDLVPVEKFSLSFSSPSLTSDLITFASVTVSRGGTNIAAVRPFSVRLLVST